MCIRKILILILVFSSTISSFSQTDKTKRISYSLYLGLGARVPMSASYYNLWKDLAIGDVNYQLSDGWAHYISANWADYDFTYLRTDIDFLISKNLSIGIFAFPDKYKKVFTNKGKTDNWTGDGSNGLEDHWELKRKLRITTYNFGSDIKLKVQFNGWELSLSYLYGLSYLWRSSYNYSYQNQETGTGDDFLGLIFISNGNLTKLRFTGSSDFHRVELDIKRLKSKESAILKIGYQYLKMNNVKYKVLKYNDVFHNEVTSYFSTAVFDEYNIGDSDYIYIDNNKFNLDLSCFYITLIWGLHW